MLAGVVTAVVVFVSLSLLTSTRLLRNEIRQLAESNRFLISAWYQTRQQLERVYCNGHGWTPETGWPVPGHLGPAEIADEILARLPLQFGADVAKTVATKLAANPPGWIPREPEDGGGYRPTYEPHGARGHNYDWGCALCRTAEPEALTIVIETVIDLLAQPAKDLNPKDNA